MHCAIGEFAAALDEESIAAIFEQLDGYAIPEAYAEEYAGKKKALRNLDWEALKSNS